MTFEEVLKACAIGEMPKVKDSVGRVGQVITIKNGDGYHGIAVLFDDQNWADWFRAGDDTDRRRKYMRDLTLND
jgi:hypothetical protein